MKKANLKMKLKFKIYFFILELIIEVFFLFEKKNQKDIESELNKKEYNNNRKNISVLSIVGANFNIPSEPSYNMGNIKKMLQI